MVMTKEQNCKEAAHHGVAREEVSEQGKHGAEYREKEKLALGTPVDKTQPQGIAESGFGFPG